MSASEKLRDFRGEIYVGHDEQYTSPFWPLILAVVEAAELPASWISRDGLAVAERDMKEGWKPTFAELTAALAALEEALKEELE